MYLNNCYMKQMKHVQRCHMLLLLVYTCSPVSHAQRMDIKLLSNPWPLMASFEAIEINKCPNTGQVLKFKKPYHHFYAVAACNRDLGYAVAGEYKRTLSDEEKKNVCREYPLDVKYCAWLDRDGMGATEIGDRCYDSKTVYLEGFPIKQVRRPWCKDDVDNNNGYCNNLGPELFVCGTGACCKNAEDQSEVKGCGCNKKEWPYTWEDRNECNDNGLLGTTDRHGCQPAVKYMACECVDLEAGFYSSNSINMPCGTCPKGQYLKDCKGSKAGKCEDCAAGTFQNTANTQVTACNPCANGQVSGIGEAECTQCNFNSYAQERKQCQLCKSCEENTVNDGCLNNDEAMDEGTCKCKAGYFLDTTTVSCEPCALASYKEQIGNEACTECAENRNTSHDASTDATQCLCKENYFEHDNTCWSCRAYDLDKPFNDFTNLPRRKEDCTACPDDHYWDSNTENTCVPIPRRQIEFDDTGAFKITPQPDQYRTLSPATYKNQKTLFSVGSGQYLKGNTVATCHQSCNSFEERKYCGEPHEDQMYISFQYSGHTYLELVQTSIANDHPTEWMSAYFLQRSANDIQLKREGVCESCKICPDNQYQAGCLQTETCADCKECIEINKWAFHALNEQIDNRNWKGGCDFPHAQRDYTCLDCQTWFDHNQEYFIVVGCGNTQSFNRWQVSTDSEGLLSLKSKNCEYETTDEDCKMPDGTSPIHHRYTNITYNLPYCPPGWFVNLKANGCSLSSDSTHTTAWTAACCQQCGDETKYLKAKSSLYTPCTGQTNKDTEIYTDRCDDGYYKNMTETGEEECTACTTC